MKGYSNFKIAGVPIKDPTGFSISRYNITTMARLGNGDMVGDLVAKKRKFFFEYAAITGMHLDIILNAIWETNDIFYTLTYKENGKSKSAVVYVGEIPSKLHRGEGDWVWRDVNFNFIEK